MSSADKRTKFSWTKISPSSRLSHHTSNTCVYLQSQGQPVDEFSDEESLILLNNNEPTRHSVANGTFFAINLPTTTDTSTLFDWQFLTSYNTGDHWPIGIQYYNYPNPHHRSTKWISKTQTGNCSLKWLNIRMCVYNILYKTTIQFLQRALKSLASWSSETPVSFSPLQKCNVSFSTKRRTTNNQ